MGCSTAAVGSRGGVFAQSPFQRRSFWRCCMYMIALLVRVALVAYSSYHDKHFEVKFTDIDYHVFTDAARMLLDGRSVYDRHTYRYTPFLAYLMIPNITVHPSFGKLLFSACDLLTGYMLERTLNTPALWLPCLWLFNPFVMSISARGNADCLICFLVVGTVYYLKRGALCMSAIFYGLSVHFKLYPIIYAVPLMLSMYSNTLNQVDSLGSFVKGAFRLLVMGLNLQHIKFGLISASVFFVTGFLAYRLSGYDFIYETYLYHYIRQDHRHNFSIYFNYMYYLVDSGQRVGYGYVANLRYHQMNPLLSFLPQLLCVLGFGLLGIWDVELSLFLQTISFVSLNKVCTCQYYLWWMCLLPLVLGKISFSRRNVVSLSLSAGGFVFSNAVWLLFAYLLEMQGYNTFLLLLYASAFFVLSQMSIGWVLLHQLASGGVLTGESS
ncbi:mannosyltransferase (PIG-M) containing domain [Babesia divergens]|uniref:GPI mannosyltransferase 1 n=1 Tax=Babesia divergens TaxID=32595 RepID=A0AAD9G906_BABDI|nr:mannosyltransferase (PIG-M) containing domain [Babesia divergens]